jgi:hypothetical protein
MSLEYPKLNTWTEANLGKFLIPLLYEGIFLLYEGLPVGLLIPSLRRSLFSEGLFLLYEGLAMGSKKISYGPKYFNGIIPCYPSARHHPVNVYAIIIVLFISIDKSNIRTRSLRNTHSQETQHLSWETL